MISHASLVITTFTIILPLSYWGPFFSYFSSLMGKPIPWHPMLPWWSLPLPSFYPYIKTLVKLRLPDFPPEDLEATQPNNLVNARLQVLHLLKHLQSIPFASVLWMTGTILSASRTQNQQLIAIAKKLCGMFTFTCVYIYIYILIYTHTHKKTYAPAPLHYIYIVLSHLICQCCFQKNTKKHWHLSSD